MMLGCTPGKAPYGAVLSRGGAGGKGNISTARKLAWAYWLVVKRGGEGKMIAVYNLGRMLEPQWELHRL